VRRTRTEMTPKEVTYETQCDHCGKREKGYDPNGWHHFSSHHGDWGSDSVDSWEYFDACSFDCYLALVRKAFEGYGGYRPTLEVDGKDWHFLQSMIERKAA
jgi:hypothetical protein